MAIHLEKLAMKHAEELFAFEKQNRIYFEQTFLPRPAVYFEKDSFLTILNTLIQEEETMFVIYMDEQLVDRINITDVQQTENEKMGSVGYRIGKKYTGRGVASRALYLMKKIAKEQHFTSLEAGTAIDNYGSQIVLLKNQFQFKEKCIDPSRQFGPSGTYVCFEYLL
ncbi:GNAT family N-acetyltransferase [Candidatus Enterococcus willemsii]|uniref:N-acetyltransferase domain-containing protein n=1 Tax=Candidatus Enterococcus willemsii TaxID=1857215 RepID=A0ABQ6Z1P5_9ENTE|nr:GNAT family protein [Enterococcus sp. CU12B]KAF1305413.1 hypothetical protein BAU17_02670 [Enterococcus sp. CU12B]